MARGTEVLAVNPEGQKSVAEYWDREGLPFVGLADPRHEVATAYGQQVSLLRLGRLPALLVVDRDGRVAYSHYGDNMADIPGNAKVLALLEELLR